jgi:streptomycin 6-kinase
VADDGVRLMALASRAETLAQRWGLELGPAYSHGLSHHWAASVRLPDGGHAVLKLGVPVPAGMELAPMACEATALRAYGGHGAVRVLDHDLALGALLLERADPGTLLATMVPESDDLATAALVDVMQQLHACVLTEAVAAALPELAEEGDSFAQYLAEYPSDEPDGPLPGGFVERAAALFDELVGSAPVRVVLHGDLHHANVLASTRGQWLAIDPHGMVGDPGYDVGAMVFNPDPDDHDPVLAALVPARVEQLADLSGIPVERVVAWAFVKAILHEVWNWEDGDGVGSRALDVARLLHPRLG